SGGPAIVMVEGLAAVSRPRAPGCRGVRAHGDPPAFLLSSAHDRTSDRRALMGEPGRPIAGLVLVEAPPPTASYHHLAPGLAVAVDYTLEWLPGGYHLFEPADRRGTFAVGQLSRDGETVEMVDFEGGAL